MLTGVMINDYHHHLRGEGGVVFIKELHDSHACNHTALFQVLAASGSNSVNRVSQSESRI